MDNLTGELLRIVYMQVDTVALWDRNPKRHDIEKLIESFIRHGFRDAPIFDKNINGGEGGLVAGNGRATALGIMQHDRGMDPPAGIALDDNKNWYMPVQFGMDAASQAQAESFAIDHNNLTLVGMHFEDVAHLWDPSYADVLYSLGESGIMPISVDPSELDSWIQGTELMIAPPPSLDQLESEYGDPDNRDFWPVIRVQVSPDTKDRYDVIMGSMAGEDEAEKFDRLLSAVDIAVITDET